MPFVGDDWLRTITTSSWSRRAAGGWLGPGFRKGWTGLSRLRALLAEQVPQEWDNQSPEEAARRVVIGIETDRGLWCRR